MPVRNSSIISNVFIEPSDANLTQSTPAKAFPSTMASSPLTPIKSTPIGLSLTRSTPTTPIPIPTRPTPTKPTPVTSIPIKPPPIMPTMVNKTPVRGTPVPVPSQKPQVQPSLPEQKLSRHQNRKRNRDAFESQEAKGNDAITHGAPEPKAMRRSKENVVSDLTQLEALAKKADELQGYYNQLQDAVAVGMRQVRDLKATVNSATPKIGKTRY
ncbi:hypothetical protein F4808DRAFT_457588 [Astrocystis sublimbata]|nr:hypothetical protein F4808DRAFT_457588 [Astrocystis sublimbata]